MVLTQLGPTRSNHNSRYGASILTPELLIEIVARVGPKCDTIVDYDGCQSWTD